MRPMTFGFVWRSENVSWINGVYNSNNIVVLTVEGIR